jgi:tetratricopeptide (TPR) repeat protein
MRYAALLLLLCACNSLSIEQRNELAQIQERAKNYFDRGLIAQAIGQIDRGLELAPEDYQLNTLKGTILLRQSSSALGQDHRLLDEATALLEKVFETRAANRHEPYLLFNYALAQEKQGRRNLGESISLRDQATRAPEKAPLLEKAEAATAAANAYFAGAREHLATLHRAWRAAAPEPPAPAAHRPGSARRRRVRRPPEGLPGPARQGPGLREGGDRTHPHSRLRAEAPAGPRGPQGRGTRDAHLDCGALLP